MADPGQFALIHAEIDGELDAAQRAELARALLADPKARALRDDLRRVCKALDELEPVEPPAGLRRSILVALPQEIRRSRWLGNPRGLGPRSAIAAWKYAAIFAGMLVAGAVMFELVRSPAPEPRELAGTIALDPAATPVDSAQIGNGLVSGRVSLYRDRTTLTLRFELEASAPVDARVTSEGHILEIMGINRAAATGPAEPGTPAAAALPGVAMHGQDITVTLISGGHPIGTATLRAPGSP
jgi:hypothetical protein